MGAIKGSRAAVLVMAVLAHACTKSSPTAPAPPTTAAATAAVAAIFLTPNSWDMPASGGSLELVIATTGNSAGSVIAPRTRPDAGGAAGVQASFFAGQKVRHGTFGDGIVVSSKLVENDEEVTVAFAGKGVKRLLASFAKLEKAE